MHDEGLEGVDRNKLRTGVWLSSVSIVWTLFSSVVSVTIGLSRGSLVLVAFGMTGFLDAAGSTALVVHFRHALRHEEFSDKHERVAFLVINTGLIVVALVTAGASVHRLMTGSHAESTALGVIVAGASAVVLSVLAIYKRKIGAAIPSEALKADGVLSATGAVLAVVTVVGAALADAGIWWADPVAAALVGVCALAIGVVLKVRH